MPDVTTKACSKCGAEYPATTEFFNTDNTKPMGLYSSCKKCVAAYGKKHRKETEKDKKRYWDNREVELTRNKEYRQRKRAEKPPRILKTPEEYSQYKHGWYIANRDRLLAENKERYHKNIDQIKITAKAYREKNRVKIRISKSASKARRKIRIKEAGGHFTPSDVAQQYKSQKGLCWWCGKVLGDNYHVDHLTPLARGGSNAPQNIVISCPHCNCSRQDKMPHEWNGRLL